MVYQGTHGTGLAAAADLVFPTLSYVERAVVFKNLMGFAQRSSSVVSYNFDAKSDLDVFRGLLRVFLRGFFDKFVNFDYYCGIFFNLGLVSDFDFLVDNKFVFSGKKVVELKF